MWYVLVAPLEEVVHQDLLLAGVDSVRLTYEVKSWHPRKSVVVRRMHSMLEGYLFVETPVLPAEATRHSCHYLVGGRSGSPLRVHDAEEFIYRCESGEFDVDLTRGVERPLLSAGTEVLVEMLGLTGTIVGRRKHQYEVDLLGGKRVLVGQGGLALV